uniref:Uncharacterized protein n=1 Tax=Picea glauca TaxID=3330 RepID=A0A101M332_PICGL|nr:hypothetical protein ABT39_MTgene7 [Picea glauca]
MSSQKVDFDWLLVVGWFLNLEMTAEFEHASCF